MEHFGDFIFFILFSPTTMLGAVVLLLVLYLVSVTFMSKEKRNEPPGPRPLPLLGNLLQLDLKRPHKTLCELSKKYGSVFTLYFGTNKVVVLAGYETVREALVNYAVTARCSFTQYGTIALFPPTFSLLLNRHSEPKQSEFDHQSKQGCHWRMVGVLR